MKIALIAPVEETVPPQKYGAIEWIVYYLAKRLGEKGHEVDLYAVKNSAQDKSYNLVPTFEENLRSKKEFTDNLELRNSGKLLALSNAANLLKTKQYDVINNHAGWRFLLYSRFVQQSSLVTTHHRPLNIDYQNLVLSEYKNLFHISLSLNQKKDLPELNYIANIYNGIDIQKFSNVGYNFDEYSDMVFIGRINSERGPVDAEKISHRLKKKLVIGAKVDFVEESYLKSFQELVDEKLVMFMGEVNFEQKKTMLSKAKLLLFPVKYEDPCPLTPMEAMASGTPVVAYSRGSLSEIVTDGKTGFLVNESDKFHTGNFIVQKTGLEGLAEAVRIIYEMPKEKYFEMRAQCRIYAEKHFSVDRMVGEYEKVYEKIKEISTH